MKNKTSRNSSRTSIHRFSWMNLIKKLAIGVRVNKPLTMKANISRNNQILGEISQRSQES